MKWNEYDFDHTSLSSFIWFLYTCESASNSINFYYFIKILLISHQRVCFITSNILLILFNKRGNKIILKTIEKEIKMLK